MLLNNIKETILKIEESIKEDIRFDKDYKYKIKYLYENKKEINSNVNFIPYPIYINKKTEDKITLDETGDNLSLLINSLQLKIKESEVDLEWLLKRLKEIREKILFILK